jgi:hypothetical protein
VGTLSAKDAKNIPKIIAAGQLWRYLYWLIHQLFQRFRGPIA